MHLKERLYCVESPIACQPDLAQNIDTFVRSEHKPCDSALIAEPAIIPKTFHDEIKTVEEKKDEKE